MKEISPVHRYVDSGLNYLFTNNYELSIRLLPDGFSYSIFDTERNRFLALEEYQLLTGLRFPDVMLSDDYQHWLDKIINSNYLLKESFNNVFVLAGGAKYTLIPVPLYDSSKNRMYLSFNHTLSDNELVCNDMIAAPETYLLYSIPVPVNEWISKNFPSARRFHVCSSLIRSFFTQFRGGSPVTRILANIQSEILDILVFKGSEFQLCNSFHYSADTDLLYYLLFVTEQLKINTEGATLFVSGRFENNSELAGLLKTYFRFVELIPEANEFKFSAVFDDAPLHQYYDLLNVTLCG